MPFILLETVEGKFTVKSLSTPQSPDGSIFILSDVVMSGEQEKQVENFSRLASEVLVVSPIQRETAPDLPALVECLRRLFETRGHFFIVAFGRFAPIMVEKYGEFAKAQKTVFVNPVFSRDIATKMAAFETPSLVVTSTPGNLDHDPDAVKYHDLMANSSIQYIRGVTGNPLFLKFTQSFNSIQRFLADE